MGWVRIDDNAPHHRKMLKAGPAACWLWVCGLAYCQRQSSDGVIPFEAVAMLGVGNWKKCAAFLVDAGLWHKEAEGYRVHDYLQWNASRDERREQEEANRLKVIRYREKKRQERNQSVTEPRHQDVTGYSSVTDTPLHSTPSPLPSTPTANAGEPQQRQRQQPRRFDRQHSGHVFGFCEFKCLSEEKISEFARDLPRGLSDPQNFDRVVTWARDVRDGWGDKPKIEPEWWKFWQARWAERPKPREVDERDVRGNAALAAINERIAKYGGAAQ
jgi:hypothetical protein